ncbi:MAG: ABC transporter permease [Bacteroidales bacterium]|nr:ABC transporter permease [Bacteroidales bacterium]
MWRENIIFALRSLVGNSLRSGLTVTIIATGITCLVGIQTSIDVLTSVIADFYENVGAESLTLSRDDTFYSGDGNNRARNESFLTYEQVKAFSGAYSLPAKKCIFTLVAEGISVKAEGNVSEPDITVYAVEGDYLDYSGMRIDEGRYFSNREFITGERVCIIGSELVRRLFGDDSPTGKTVRTTFGRYRIIGTLERAGAFLSNNGDATLLIPVSCARHGILSASTSFNAGIIPLGTPINEAADYAGNLFRSFRRLRAGDADDFRIENTDALERQLSGIKGSLSLAALAAGLLTILGAAVGLMNIMLVAIKERTREIGTRKAMGATSSNIKIQFLAESVIIGQLGGIIGILLGTAIGNVLSLFLETPVVLPWKWIILSVAICFTVSILSGYIPAGRAAALDPIEALREE